MRTRGFWRRSPGRGRGPIVLAAVILLTLLGLLAGALYSQAQYRRAAAQLIMQRDRQVASLAAVRLRDELLKLA
ncbi:MAG: hypothetical protein ACM30E_02055, partial [Nitrososphaerales archaeon]